MFSDDIPTWAEDAITTLANAGVVVGNPDGTFEAASSLNRAEAAAMLWRVLMMGDPTGAESAPFTDVALSNWYTDYVASLKGLSLVDGNPDGSFQPAESINRAEFLQLAMNVYLYQNPTSDINTASMTTAYQDLDTSAWYAQVVSAATAWGFVEGNACTGGMCFNADSEISRAEASQILFNMFGASL
jgi:N-acetylmuramoyl-L-alanine amidase